MNKILVAEDRGQIENIQRSAASNVVHLNAAYLVAPFTTEKELMDIIQDCPRFNEKEMRKDSFTAKLMDRGQSVPTPNELIIRTATMKAAMGCFSFVRFVDKWEPDVQMIDDEADRKFRRYITEDWQFALWEFQGKLVEALNSFPMGDTSRKRNFILPGNEVVVFNRRSKLWERNLSYLFSRDQFRY